MKSFFTSILLWAAFLSLSAQPGIPGKAVTQASGESVNTSMEVKVFPNPVHYKRFTVELSNQQVEEIRITNIAGTQVYLKKFTTPVSRYQVLLGNIPNGIYLLKITSSKNSKTLKLLVSTNQ